VRVSDKISLPVPATHAARYQAAKVKDLLFGLRPEHITEQRVDHAQNSDFTVTLDVDEPMGMETMVFFTIDGQEICGRVDPAVAAKAGEQMKLHANMEHMHLIDPASGAVL
jgi:multiple sugar transport system ATP-binding protein